jgi:RNA polymerase sigma-70 factor (ECF subfamily)
MTGISYERAAWLAKRVLPHEPALRAWLRARRVAGLEIDDVVQETYAILAGLESVDDIRNPKTYAFQIAQRIVLSFLRRAKIVSIRGVPDIEALDAAADVSSPEQSLSDRDELYHLGEAIAALPKQARRVFVMRRVEGISQREIAAQLGISESAVEKHMGRAIRLLADSLDRVGRRRGQTSTFGEGVQSGDRGRPSKSGFIPD